MQGHVTTCWVPTDPSRTALPWRCASTWHSNSQAPHNTLFPALHQVAIEPKTKGDLDKMTNGLIKLAQEDPSFHFRWAVRAGSLEVLPVGWFGLRSSACSVAVRLLEQHGCGSMAADSCAGRQQAAQ